MGIEINDGDSNNSSVSPKWENTQQDIVSTLTSPNEENITNILQEKYKIDISFTHVDKLSDGTPCGYIVYKSGDEKSHLDYDCKAIFRGDTLIKTIGKGENRVTASTLRSFDLKNDIIGWTIEVNNKSLPFVDNAIIEQIGWETIMTCHRARRDTNNVLKGIVQTEKGQAYPFVGEKIIKEYEGKKVEKCNHIHKNKDTLQGSVQLEWGTQFAFIDDTLITEIQWQKIKNYPHIVLHHNNTHLVWLVELEDGRILPFKGSETGEMSLIQESDGKYIMSIQNFSQEQGHESLRDDDFKSVMQWDIIYADSTEQNIKKLIESHLKDWREFALPRPIARWIRDLGLHSVAWRIQVR